MTNANPRTVHHTFAPASDSSGETTLDTIGEGEAFQAEALTIHTVSDPAGNIDMTLLDGQEVVAPDNERLTLAESDTTLQAGNTYDVGDEITLRWSTNASWTQTPVVLLLDGINTPSGG